MTTRVQIRAFRTLLCVLPILPVFTALLCAQFLPTPGREGKDVVWVPTSPEMVEKMLDLAAVTPDDFVMDLGSGDGRNVIAAARRGARALGVEYDPELVELSRRRARDAGLSEKASFIEGDMYQADVSQASVLALFLKPENLDRIVDKFLAMRPGSRIVLNTFPITDWEPDATVTLPPPCKAWCTAMLVVVPARVGGTWQMGSTTLTLRQYFQEVRGTIGARKVVGRLRGDRIALDGGSIQYAGVVEGNRIHGQAIESGRQTEWVAERLND